MCGTHIRWQCGTCVLLCVWRRAICICNSGGFQWNLLFSFFSCCLPLCFHGGHPPHPVLGSTTEGVSWAVSGVRLTRQVESLHTKAGCSLSMEFARVIGFTGLGTAHQGCRKPRQGGSTAQGARLYLWLNYRKLALSLPREKVLSLGKGSRDTHKGCENQSGNSLGQEG